MQYVLYLIALGVIGFFINYSAAEKSESIVDSGILQLIKGTSSFVLFYSKDCTPCHVEINMLPELKKAMEGNHIAVVSLTSPDKAITEKLKDLDIRLVDASDQDASALLRAFNNQHLALPFSMALDEKGIVCARRAGLLGLDIIKDWRKQCSQ